MGIFGKLKKLGSFHIAREDIPPPPPPNVRHQMRDEAIPSNINYGPLPQSFFNAVNSARQQAGYDHLPIIPRGPTPMEEEDFMYENPGGEFPAFNRSRSKSRERPVDRSARHRSRGTPVKFRRRPISPELLQSRASSPFLIRQHSFPTSPNMHHHFQHVPRQPQHDMMMAYPGQFFPQFQQQPFYPMMNPNVMNMPPWFMMRQPQMHPFF